MGQRRHTSQVTRRCRQRRDARGQRRHELRKQLPQLRVVSELAHQGLLCALCRRLVLTPNMPLHHHQQLLATYRLREIVVAPRPKASLALALHGVRREGDYPPTIACLPQGLGRPVAIQHRHLHVHQDDREGLPHGLRFPRPLAGLLPVLR